MTAIKDKRKELNWRVHTSELFNRITEISSNVNETAAIIIPLNIFRSLICEVAQRAIEINDKKLNSLMCRLALYSISDPQDKDYNNELCENIIREGELEELKQSLNSPRNTIEKSMPRSVASQDVGIAQKKLGDVSGNGDSRKGNNSLESDTRKDSENGRTRVKIVNKSVTKDASLVNDQSNSLKDVQIPDSRKGKGEKQ